MIIDGNGWLLKDSVLDVLVDEETTIFDVLEGLQHNKIKVVTNSLEIGYIPEELDDLIETTKITHTITFNNVTVTLQEDELIYKVDSLTEYYSKLSKQINKFMRERKINFEDIQEYSKEHQVYYRDYENIAYYYTGLEEFTEKEAKDFFFYIVK